MKIKEFKICPICNLQLIQYNEKELICTNKTYSFDHCDIKGHLYTKDIDNEILVYHIDSEKVFVFNFNNSKDQSLTLRKFNDSISMWESIGSIFLEDLSLLYNRSKIISLAEIIEFYN